jgi:hypothetical protein
LGKIKEAVEKAVNNLVSTIDDKLDRALSEIMSGQDRIKLDESEDHRKPAPKDATCAKTSERKGKEPIREKNVNFEDSLKFIGREIDRSFRNSELRATSKTCGGDPVHNMLLMSLKAILARLQGCGSGGLSDSLSDIKIPGEYVGYYDYIEVGEG